MPLPEQTFNNYDELRAYINTFITSNGGRDITGTEHNNVENALLTFLAEIPLNDSKVDIHSTGGSYELVRGFTVFNIITPSLLSFGDNVQNEWYIVNATPADIPLASDSHYFSMQIEQTVIPANTTIHIAKSENDQWLQVNNSEIEGIGISGYSGFSGSSGYSGISGSGISGFSGYSGSGSSGYSGFSGTSTSGYSGYSGTSTSGYSGFSGNSGYSGYSSASGYSGFSGLSGLSGYSGYSGFSGKSGYSGYSGSGQSGYSGYSGLGLSGYSGFSGATSTSGYSGYSGAQGAPGPGGGDSGFSGYSGQTAASGYSGYSGKSGYSGFSGSGISGYSGYSGSGTSGYSGYSGNSGYSGYSGSGISGYSGFSGKSGYSGFSGQSGYSGFSGNPGLPGTSGFSGYSGAGLSGFSGYSGFSGKSGYSGFSGNGQSGYSGFSGAAGSGSGDVLLRTLSGLRAETSTSTAVRYYMTDIGLQGFWYYDSTDTTSTDNTALVVTSSTRRYKRIYDNVNVDVKWFGVLGNGTDETTKVQLAFDNTAGKTLVFENITVKVGGTFGSANWSIRITGTNRKTVGYNGVIEYIANGTQPDIFLFYDGCVGCEIVGLEVNMLGLTGSPVFGTVAVYLNGCSDIYVNLCKVHDNGHAGILIVGGTDCIVRDNYVWNTDAAIYILANSSGGVQNVLVTGNTIYGGTSEGIAVFSHGDASLITHNAIVTHNVVHDKASGAFNFERTINLLATDNQAYNCTGGMWFLTTGSGLAYNEYTIKVHIADNRFDNCTEGLTHVGDYSLITNNTFLNITYSAIGTNGHPDSGGNLTVLAYGIDISGNHFYNCSLEPSYPVIELQQLRDVVVRDNVIVSSPANVKAIRFQDCTGLISENYCPDSKLELFSTDTTHYGNRMEFRDNTFVDVDLTPTYPLSGGVWNWRFTNNYYINYYADPTLFFYDLSVTSGALNGINERFIKDTYYIAASQTVTSIAVSWFGRVITIEAKGAAVFTHGSNISNIGGVNVTLAAGQQITYRYDLTKWREMYVSLS